MADTTTLLLLTDSTPDGDTILKGITHLHAACILHDHTMATFLPPLSHDTMHAWWRDRLGEVTSRRRHMIVCLAPTSARTASVPSPFESQEHASPVMSMPPSTSSGPPELDVAGVVSLSMPETQTGPFRGLVEKLFVSPNHRRRGIARLMMARLEQVALAEGRWSLMLDTEKGSDAELVYPRLGYRRLGVVEEYGYSPRDGRLVDEVWFWKDLRKSSPL